MHELELSNGTLRQRRNLMIVSLILIFTHHAEVSFGNTVKLHGATLIIENPENIFSMLLLCLAYFLWRFYKYFFYDHAHNVLKSQYRSTLSTLQDREISNQIGKQLPTGFSSFSGFESYSTIKERMDDNGYMELPVTFHDDSGPNSYSEPVSIHEKPIIRKKYHAVASFAFRGKIISDFYVPFALAFYAVLVSIF